MTNRELAKKLADKYLRSRSSYRYVLLFNIASYIDSEMVKIRNWKRKQELHTSLYDYEDYVPNCKWVPAEALNGSSLCAGLGGDFLVVENPYYRG